MTDNVAYDTNLLVYSNSDLAKRATDSELDERLRAVERFLRKEVMARYNPKLREEYSEHVKLQKNDLIVAFFVQLVDFGGFTKSNKMVRHRWADASEAGWPGHDQHVLAAVDGTKGATVYTTEHAHDVCSTKIKRRLQIKVIKL